MPELNFHEDLKTHSEVKRSSDRNFGLVFAAFFVLVAVAPLRRGGGVRGWAFAAAAVFLLLALTAPAVLHPLNVVWSRLGHLMGRIMNPVVTGIIFFGIFAPAGFFLRLTGKDFLHLKYDPKAASYWIRRDPPGPAPPSMARQF